MITPEIDRIGEISGAFLSFDLGAAIDMTPLTSGMSNPCYLVTGEADRQYVVKFLQNQTPISVENEVVIQEQLSQAGIPGVNYLKNRQGNWLYENNGHYAVVSPKVEGVHPKIGEEDTCFTMGRELALFHTSVHTLPRIGKGWLSPVVVQEKLPQLATHELYGTIKMLTEAGKPLFSCELPSGIIHGDLCTSNILVDPADYKTSKAIFDFEEAEANIFLIDIARTIWDVCMPRVGDAISDNLLDVFLTSYSSVRNITGDETKHMKEALDYTTGAMLIWFIENDAPIRTEQIFSQWSRTFKK